MGRVLGAAVLLVIALAVAWTPLQEMNDQAFRTAALQASDEIRPIVAELTAAEVAHDLDGIEKAGANLSELVQYWQETLGPMAVSRNMTPAKSYWSSTLTNLDKSGNAYVRAANQERAGQKTEAADSWNYAEEYRMAAMEQWPHAVATLSPSLSQTRNQGP